MIFPVLLFTLAFSLMFTVAAENFLLGKWLLSTYIVPSFFPTVINCNAEENPLPIAYTVRTIQNRTEFVRFMVFALHVYLGHMVMHHILPNLYFLYGISLLSAPILYYRRPIAVLIESQPRGSNPLSYPQYIDKMNNVSVPAVKKELSGLFTTPPEDSTIKRALNMCNYDTDKTVDALKTKIDEVNRKDDDQKFFWDTHDNMETINEYKTAKVEIQNDINEEETYQQQSLFANNIKQMLQEYNISQTGVVFLSGNTSGREYATYCRVPMITKEENEVVTPLTKYEDWFDRYVSGSWFMTTISFGPINTLEYGIDASPDTKVCFLSQTWLWDNELSIYGKSKNVLVNPIAALNYSRHAWVSINVADETVYFDNVTPFYEGDDIYECIDKFVDRHGFIDTVTKKYLENKATFGTHELFFPPDDDNHGHLQMPNFHSSILLLNPLTLLRYVILNGHDVLLPLFPVCINNDMKVSTSCNSSTFLTIADNIPLQRALHQMVLDTSNRPILTKDILKPGENEGYSGSEEEEDEDSIEEASEEELVKIETDKKND